MFIDHSAGTSRLITKIAPDTRYAAVSYRWGSRENYYMLTEKSANGMCGRISMDVLVLSETILDTFNIARRLSLKYIWVDRLDIFQDSRDDWSREASRMASIYEISASCASHESQGCFGKRNVAGIQTLQLISNPLSPHNSTVSSSYIASNEPPLDQKDEGKLEHLVDRRWLYQERIVFRRIVNFAEDQVYGECKQLKASEAWPEPHEIHMPSDRLMYQSYMCLAICAWAFTSIGTKSSAIIPSANLHTIVTSCQQYQPWQGRRRKCAKLPMKSTLPGFGDRASMLISAGHSILTR